MFRRENFEISLSTDNLADSHLYCRDSVSSTHSIYLEEKKKEKHYLQAIFDPGLDKFTAPT